MVTLHSVHLRRFGVHPIGYIMSMLPKYKVAKDEKWKYSFIRGRWERKCQYCDWGTEFTYSIDIRNGPDPELSGVKPLFTHTVIGEVHSTCMHTCRVPF